jgi:hypothetical protein
MLGAGGNDHRPRSACGSFYPASALRISSGGTPTPRHDHVNVVRIASSHPGRPCIPSGRRAAHRSAASVSASINSSCAVAVRCVIGAHAGVRPCKPGTTAFASQRQVTATPAMYQSLTPLRVFWSRTRSASTQIAAKSARRTRRFPGGIRSISPAAISTHPRSHNPPTIDEWRESQQHGLRDVGQPGGREAKTPGAVPRRLR